jgi:hypothetical protein
LVAATLPSLRSGTKIVAFFPAVIGFFGGVG